MSPLSDPSPSDVEKLIARARAGEPLAWEELFQKCYPKVVRVVRRKLDRPMRNLYDSTDFASDVMKSLAANLDHLEFDSFDSLMAFLAHVAQQKVVDEYRRTHAQKRDCTREERLGHVDEDGLGPQIAASDPTASKYVLAEETRERLAANSDEAQRQAIHLKIQEYSNQEIATRVGWDLRKVQRFFQGLKERYGFAG